MNSEGSASQVIERLKVLLSATTDQDIARALGVSKPTISSWRQRDTVPYAFCIQIAKERGLQLDWLLLGEGEMYKNEPRLNPISERRAQIIVELYEALSEDQQKEILAAVEEKKRMNELVDRVNQLQKKVG